MIGERRPVSGREDNEVGLEFFGYLKDRRGHFAGFDFAFRRAPIPTAAGEELLKISLCAQFSSGLVLFRFGRREHGHHRQPAVVILRQRGSILSRAQRRLTKICRQDNRLHRKHVFVACRARHQNWLIYPPDRPFGDRPKRQFC